jgi:hypothetical protein
VIHGDVVATTGDSNFGGGIVIHAHGSLLWDGGASEVQRVSEVVQARSNGGGSSEDMLREVSAGTQVQARAQP